MPYSLKQVLDNAYHIVFNIGIFEVDFREWNNQAGSDKTLSHLKLFFNAAHREWRLSIQNGMGSLYGAAHNATENPDGSYLQQATVDAIANLAIATASDRAAITQLTATVMRLITDLATVNKNIFIALQSKRASRGS